MGGDIAMADDSRMSHISDDWQEVDEAASVKSVDTFEGDDLIALSYSSSPVHHPVESRSVDAISFLDDMSDQEDDAFDEPTPPMVATIKQPPVPQTGGSHPVVSRALVPAEPESSPLEMVDVQSVDTSFNEVTLPIRQQPRLNGRQPSWSSFGYTYGAPVEKGNEAVKHEPASSSIPIDIPKDGARVKPAHLDFNSEDLQQYRDPDEDEGSAVFYHNVLIETRTLTDDVAACAKELGGNKVSTLFMLAETCCDLSGLLYELEPILATYASYCTKHGRENAAQTLPLNPNLIVWMESVKTDLRSLLERMHTLRPGPEDQGISWPLGATTIPYEINSYISERVQGLESARNTFQDFLPILKADYDEFRTDAMNFPTYQSEDSETKPLQDAPIPAVAHIRRELYNLKDRLQEIILFLTGLINDIHPETINGVPEALRALVDLVETITTIVTNNGSEWIDSEFAPSKKRIISFPEFVNLCPDMLRDITMHLEEFHRQLDLSDEPVFRKYSRQMIQNHQITSLTEAGQLHNLVSTIALVETMLIAR